MGKKKLEATLYPNMQGPFSQAVTAGGFIFISGQIPYDRKTDAVVKGSPADQIRKIMENVSEILGGIGATYDDVVKVTLFIRSYHDYTEISETYGTFFTGSFPARTNVAVADLPKGVFVIADIIAYIGPVT